MDQKNSSTETILNTINYFRFPNFLIVGANKAGTTSIYDFCNQHPDILMSKIKEPMFFTAKRKKRLVKSNNGIDALTNPNVVVNLDDYQSLFKGGFSFKARGEASTSYLANHIVAIPRIRAFKPDMKIIICLREPVDRAISAYNMYAGAGIEKRNIDKVVEDDILNKLKVKKGPQKYFELSKYYLPVKSYIEIFGVKNCKIIDFTKLTTDPSNCVKDIYSFLNVEDTFIPVFRKMNSSSKWNKTNSKISKNDLSKNTLMLILKYYERDISSLQELLAYHKLVTLNWSKQNYI